MGKQAIEGCDDLGCGFAYLFDHPSRLRWLHGWVCARADGELVGFVNVPWDGGVHAFVLDTMVSAPARGRGVGTHLVAVTAAEARAAGCEWLHVDFDDDLRAFYFDACGFTPTNAGLIAL